MSSMCRSIRRNMMRTYLNMNHRSHYSKKGRGKHGEKVPSIFAKLWAKVSGAPVKKKKARLNKPRTDC